MGALLDGLHTPALPNHASTLTIQETQPSRCWQNRKSLERTDGYAENSVESQVAVITVRAKASTHVALPQTYTCPSAQAHSHLTTRSTRATRKICNSPVSSHCKHDIPTESIPYHNLFSNMSGTKLPCVTKTGFPMPSQVTWHCEDVNLIRPG